MTHTLTVTEGTDDAVIQQALAAGHDVRFRADYHGAEHGTECPCCGEEGGLRWIHHTGTWDRFACDRCGHHFSIEAHVAEELPTCEEHGRPALRAASAPFVVDGWKAADQRAYREDAERIRCCSGECAEAAGRALMWRYVDQIGVEETNATLMGSL